MKIIKLFLIFGITFWIHNDLKTIQIVHLSSIDRSIIFNGALKPLETSKAESRNAGRFTIEFAEYAPPNGPATKGRATNIREFKFTVPEGTDNIVLRTSWTRMSNQIKY